MNQYAFRKLPALCCALLALAGTTAALSADLSKSTGAQLVRQYCASCHGRGGEGDGPVAGFFKLSPPDLTLIARRAGGTFPAERVRRIVDGREVVAPHGLRDMPVWGMQFSMMTDDAAMSDAAIGRVVEYLQSIQKMPAR